MQRIIALLLALASLETFADAPIRGTFIQINRSNAGLDAAAWATQLQAIKEAGLDTIIVQYSATPEVRYFTDPAEPWPEEYPALNSIISAAEGHGLSVFIGLTQDPEYWTQITARDRVLRDYLLTRVAQAERLQQSLLRQFGHSRAWIGYYIPEEIDDLHWRSAERRERMREYFAHLSERLGARDPDRLLIASAFFRGRTAPDLYARNLAGLTGGEPRLLHAVLVQDGAGVHDPPPRYASLYYETIRQAWSPKAPELWAVLELFDQTSTDGEKFQALPATAERLATQVKAVAPHVSRIVVFSLPDYAMPSGGPKQASLYEAVRSYGRP